MLPPAHVVRALGPVDVRNVWRDPMLGWVVVFPLGMALLIRWGTPALGVWLAERYGVDLVAYYPLVASFLVLVVPTFLGTVVGFLLLDHRDDGTLAALLVTPLTLGGFLIYRTALPMLVSVAMTLVVVPVAGIAVLGPGASLVSALAAAPVAALFAFFLATFAANKVQGFALSKMAGVLVWPCVLAYFVTSRWQWLFGLVPLYWPVKAVWMLSADERGVWVVLVVGLVYQGVLATVFVRQFGRVARL